MNLSLIWKKKKVNLVMKLKIMNPISILATEVILMTFIKDNPNAFSLPPRQKKILKIPEKFVKSRSFSTTSKDQKWNAFFCQNPDVCEKIENIQADVQLQSLD